jgi:hypothetical protein
MGPQFAAPPCRIWNKNWELAFVVEGHLVIGVGHEALAVLVGNLRGHGLDRDARRSSKLSLVPQYGSMGGMNCGFVTLQQCQATVTGMGGFCEVNTQYRPAPGSDRSTGSRRR